MSVDVPPTYTRAGQRCTPPAPGDAAVGLLLLVMPPLALLLWLRDAESEVTRGWLVAFAVTYAAGAVVALRGLTSDASPFRLERRFVPLPYLALAVAWAVGLPWGVAMIVAPGTREAQEAARAGELWGTPTPTATASDGSLLPGPEPGRAELWVASGATVPFGQVVVLLALACLTALVVLHVRAWRAQIAAYPRR